MSAGPSMISIDDLTADVLTGHLAPHLGGAIVSGVDVEPVGTGQMAQCFRLGLRYDRPGAGPARLLAKLPSSDPTSRATAAALRAYEVEVNVYRHLLGSLAVRAPSLYWSALDPTTSEFALLLECVHPARPGDQLAGCGPDEAASAVAELVGLHAPRWGDRRLAAWDWLHRNTDQTAGLLPAMVRALHPGFVERYGHRLDGEIVTVTERLMEVLDVHDADKPGPWTVTHGDFRPDNLLFGDPGERVAVVDWQTAVLGPGVADLSYFVASALPPALRREHEVDLVRLYQQQMASAGVAMAWDDLWWQYRRYAVGGLVMAIAASMLVERTDRGDDMFMTMTERHARHASDLDALALLADRCRPR